LEVVENMKQIVKFQDPRIRISRSVFVFALLIALTPGLGFAVDPVAMLEGAAVALLIIGGVFMGIGALFTKVKATKSLGIPAILIGAILFILSVAGFAVQVLGSGLGPGELPPPPPGYVAEWNCNFWDISTSTVGDAHDAVTEYPDTPFVAADGGTPDLNKVIATPAYDLTNRIATEDISVDDDVTTTANGFIDEDTFAFDVNCRLMNPAPAVGGGNQEIPVWGQISVTRTTGTNNNGSFAHVFYGDVTAGWYLGFGTIADSGAAAASHTSDHRYVSYTSGLTYPNPAPLVGEWIPLGTSDGDTDGEWIAVWYVLGTGFSDYTAPNLGDSVLITVRLGTSPESTVYDGNVQTVTIDLNLLARA